MQSILCYTPTFNSLCGFVPRLSVWTHLLSEYGVYILIYFWCIIRFVFLPCTHFRLWIHANFVRQFSVTYVPCGSTLSLMFRDTALITMLLILFVFIAWSILILKLRLSLIWMRKEHIASTVWSNNLSFCDAFSSIIIGYVAAESSDASSDSCNAVRRFIRPAPAGHWHLCSVRYRRICLFHLAPAGGFFPNFFPRPVTHRGCTP